MHSPLERISQRVFLNIIRLGLFGILCWLAPAFDVFSAEDAATQRPNVILIVADDLGYGEPGCYGGTEIPTPHLDALAAAGARFTAGYVTASYCAPSRAALLTGRYQTSFGFESNATGAANELPHVGLPKDQLTVADHLRRSGYATALIGKWHLGATAPFHPRRRGFDEFFGFLHEGHFFLPHPWNNATTWLRRRTLPDGGQGRWTAPGGKVIWTTHMGHFEPDYDANNPILRDSQPVLETDYLTDAFTREACDFIRRHAGQPFFLYLAYNAVHSPLQALDADLQRFTHIADIQRRIFAAMTANLDDNLGKVQQTLVQSGLERNTLIVFLSDNGGATRELTSSNAPLRGEKGTLYEGGIRVPFVIKWPERIPAGTTVSDPVSSLDLVPTVLAAAKARPLDADFHGQNLLPLLIDGQTLPARDLFWRMGTRAAMRHGDWKIVRHGRRGMVEGWKLFHLADDVSESNDLAGSLPDRVIDLETRWQQWNGKQMPALW